jgi:putative transposase
VLILIALVLMVFWLLVSVLALPASLLPALPYLHLLYQQRFNKRFTRRLKRKPVDVQKYHFSRKPQWVIDAVIYLKVFMPNAGVRSIANAFNRAHGHRATVSKSFVAKVLRNHQYAIEVQRRDMRNRMPIAIPANAIWGLDLCGKQDDAGVVHPILGIVDHGSRVAVLLLPISNMSFYTLAGHVLIAIGRHGKPTAIRTDNAPQLVSKRFRGFLKLLNVRHQRSDVGCPWQNGFIERFFGSLKQKLNQISVEDFTQLNFALREFRNWYNDIRPHQNLNGRTPAEVRAWLTGRITTEQFEEQVVQNVTPFIAWDGLLTGYRIRWKCA